MFDDQLKEELENMNAGQGLKDEIEKINSTSRANAFQAGFFEFYYLSSTCRYARIVKQEIG